VARAKGATAHRDPSVAVVFEGRCQMSFMDTLKEKLGMSKGKADDMTREHGDKVDQGIDKAGQAADSRTGGKHSSQIDSGADKAKDAAHDYGEQGGGSA
jgi:VIT1/CCC1 family predicted Fe2+/Mn2+ transporter